ncbi:hypothetical protein R1flu_026699 [Riccia fluitans]|uniref:Uncharacterized protein n=1 Tax=Riccia fluitans TaxID=41844 RepID=A0ABD1XJP6_9MARC
MASANSTQQSSNSSEVARDVLADGRAACYKARDDFYACLDKTSGTTPTEVASVGLLYPAECKHAREQYMKACRPTWVKHFDRQYAGKKRVKRLLDKDPSQGGFDQSGSRVKDKTQLVGYLSTHLLCFPFWLATPGFS